jgi:hypothetical protein
MVSIAYVTMVFLPATFMAALFDMESATELMKSDFGLYWKLAVPVTALVLLFWDVTRGKMIRRYVLAPARKRCAAESMPEELGCKTRMLTARLLSRWAEWRASKGSATTTV